MDLAALADGGLDDEILDPDEDVLALAQIGTSSDSAAMNLATASLVGTLGATLDDADIVQPVRVSL